MVEGGVLPLFCNSLWIATKCKNLSCWYVCWGRCCSAINTFLSYKLNLNSGKAVNNTHYFFEESTVCAWIDGQWTQRFSQIMWCSRSFQLLKFPTLKTICVASVCFDAWITSHNVDMLYTMQRNISDKAFYTTTHVLAPVGADTLEHLVVCHSIVPNLQRLITHY